MRLFRLRIDLLEASRHDAAGFACQQAIRDLRAMLARVPTESFLIQREWHRVERAWKEPLWQFILPDAIEFLRTDVAPLLRHVSDVDLAAESFTLKVESLKLDRLRHRASSPEALESVASDVARLPEDVHQNTAKQASIRLVLSSTAPTLADATPQQLTQIVTDLADDMKRRRTTISSFRTLDLPDFLAARGTIILGPGMQPVYVHEYRQQVEARIQEILATSAAIAALQAGRQPTPEQLIELERLLHEQLGEGSDLRLNASVARRAFGIELTGSTGVLGFIRSLLDIAALPTYAEGVQSGFDAHITAHAYSADQIRFLRAVQEVFVQRHSLQEADLYDPPFTQFGRNAADRFFTPDQRQDIFDLASRLAA